VLDATTFKESSIKIKHGIFSIDGYDDDDEDPYNFSTLNSLIWCLLLFVIAFRFNGTWSGVYKYIVICLLN
jgi:hypothetical protein